MKLFGVVLLSLIVSHAHASSMETKCSNSDGSVIWRSGLDNNQIHLKYSNFVEGTLTLGFDQVSVQMDREVALLNKSIRSCRSAALKRVFAGKVKIVAANKNPDVLRSQFPKNKIETEVICTTIVYSSMPCSRD